MMSRRLFALFVFSGGFAPAALAQGMAIPSLGDLERAEREHTVTPGAEGGADGLSGEAEMRRLERENRDIDENLSREICGDCR